MQNGLIHIYEPGKKNRVMFLWTFESINFNTVISKTLSTVCKTLVTTDIPLSITIGRL